MHQSLPVPLQSAIFVPDSGHVETPTFFARLLSRIVAGCLYPRGQLGVIGGALGLLH